MTNRSGRYDRRRPALAIVLLSVLVIATAVACTFNFVPGNPLFCSSFCNKCQGCYDEDSEWADDNCEWEVSYGNFDLDDCMSGCGAGDLPGHPMPPTWETWSCEAFDDFM